MRFVLPAVLVALVAGCAPAVPVNPPPPGFGHNMVSFQIRATYRERIQLPPGHVLTVRIEDVSLADAPARVLAEDTQPLNGRAPPYDVTLGFPAAQIQPGHSYAARAEIRDAQGRLRFTTDTRYPVVNQGPPAVIEIVMIAVR